MAALGSRKSQDVASGWEDASFKSWGFQQTNELFVLEVNSGLYDLVLRLLGFARCGAILASVW